MERGDQKQKEKFPTSSRKQKARNIEVKTKVMEKRRRSKGSPQILEKIFY